jgi:hypothetical protein
MDMFQLQTEINNRHDALMQEANQHRLARLAQQANNAESKPSFVQRLAASLSNVKVNAASTSQQDSTNCAPAKI